MSARKARPLTDAERRDLLTEAARLATFTYGDVFEIAKRRHPRLWGRAYLVDALVRAWCADGLCRVVRQGKAGRAFVFGWAEAVSPAIPDADRRDAFALITATHAEANDAVAGLLLELAADARLAPVLFSVTAHYVGMLRALAPMLGVSVEFLIQHAALVGENPPA